MNVIVGKSSDISHTLDYVQNREKDGSILRAKHSCLVRREGYDEGVALGLVAVGRSHPVMGLFIGLGC